MRNKLSRYNEIINKITLMVASNKSPHHFTATLKYINLALDDLNDYIQENWESLKEDEIKEVKTFLRELLTLHNTCVEILDNKFAEV